MTMRQPWWVVLVACGGSSGPAVTPNQPVESKPPIAEGPAADFHPGEPKPPVAEKRPHTVESPSGNRQDPYYWLRDDTRKDAAMLGYLRAENDYTAAQLASVKDLEPKLFDEMKSHVAEDNASVPMREDGYFYYTKYSAGQQQPVFMRKKGNLTAREEVILDGNELAKGHEFFSVGTTAVSRDGRYVAWADDIVGRRQFVLHVKDLKNGTLLADTASNVAPDIEWANDNKTLFYTGKDPSTLREDRVFRHVLGSNDDKLAFKEDDASYYVGIDSTKSHRYIKVLASATTNDEVRLIDAEHPDREPRVFLPREKDHLYRLDHLDGRFIIRTNDHAKNFRLVDVADGKERDRSQWHDIVPARDDQAVESFDVSRRFTAVQVRSGGLTKVLVLAGKKSPYFIEGSEAAATTSVIHTRDPDIRKVRYAYTSMITPSSVFDMDADTHSKELLKQEPVPGYDASKYDSVYLHATASDGTKVPISVVFRKDTKRDGSAPLLVGGYGSYGASSDPYFTSTRLSLLDRGWVYATAHVRGGQEMGRAWYEDGRQLHKKNTFTDFIAATEYLMAEHYGARDQTYAVGGSAGGLLMGAILNMRPDLYRGVIAEVPFVDVVTTMLDESIPLTTNEFDEWGNPKQKELYDYMLSYSPYDNVKAQPYPSIYVHTGLWDSQVQYYEPTKWVAKLRATKTDDNLVVLSTDMAAGHGGKSGRFDRLKDEARRQAFLLLVHDRPDRRPHWPK